MKTLQELQEWFLPYYSSITTPLMDLMDKIYLDPIFVARSEVVNNNLEDKTLSHFYSIVESWNVTWTLRDNPDTRLQGSFEFLPIEYVMSDGDGWDNEFGANSFAPDMKGFRPLDMFYEAAGCVGFFVGREDKQGLYVSEFDGDAEPLHLDFDGYLKMLAMTKGYGWWQSAVLELATGHHQTGVDNFKKDMPALFPDFNYDEFVALYESVRIDK